MLEEKVLGGISRHATLQYAYSRLRHRQGNNKVFYPRTFYMATKLAPIFRLTKQNGKKNTTGDCIGIFFGTVYIFVSTPDNDKKR